MGKIDKLVGKKVLVVDDEPDIHETLEEVLVMCEVDAARDFESAKEMLETNKYDIAILDIMGVDGYELLEIANEKGITSVMLTAHAISPDNFEKSINLGAHAYLPKEKMMELDVFLSDVLNEQDKEPGKLGKWFDRLKEYYAKRFGDPEWIDK
jgi:DNA-binding response OmpR family regulator